MRAWFVRMGLVVIAGCSKPTSRPSPSGPTDAGAEGTRAKVLADAAACVMTTQTTFEVAAKNLADAIAKSDREAARAAWIAAMDAWQQVESMSIGPLAPPTMPGGAGLRDLFHAWPLLGRCLIDEGTVSKSYAAADFTTTALANVRGLGAIEYLLFYDGADNGCGSSSTINATGSWAALSKEELAARKLAYAGVVANDLVAKARSLVEQWDPAKGNFAGALRTAGRGSAVYKTEDSAFDSLNEALFYVEYMVKDRKLGAPVGLSDPTACPEPPCADLLESRFAKRAKQNVRANLVAFRKSFKGCGPDFTGYAFDDLLVEAGASALVKTIDDDAVAAIAAIDAFPYATFEEAMAKDPESIKKLHAAVKRLTDALRTEFVSMLSLDVPARVSGDTD